MEPFSLNLTNFNSGIKSGEKKKSPLIFIKFKKSFYIFLKSAYFSINNFFN